jgi:hypothetical protein
MVWSGRDTLNCVPFDTVAIIKAAILIPVQHT